MSDPEMDRRPPLKILMVAPNPFFADRGFSVHVYEQARALRELGHEVSFTTYHCGRDPAGFRTYRSLRVPWYREDRAGASLHRIYLELLLLATTRRAVRRERPDVIHGHIHEGALVGLLCRRLGAPPVLLDAQGSLVGELEEKGFFRGVRKLLRPPIRGLERWITHRVDGIVTSSRALAEVLVERFGVTAEKVSLTLDGVNTDDFSPRPPDPQLARRLGLPPGKKVVVFLGLFMPHQGIDGLIEAAARTLRDRQDHHYLIMGYPNEARYQGLAERLGIGAGCTFTGRVDYSQAPDYLALGDVAVSPKLSETEGNGKLYNYMAMGLPVVAFDREVDREVLGDAAIYCRHGDVDDLARGILEALDEPERARQLGRAARERVAALFGWETVARKLESRYRALLESGPPDTDPEPEDCACPLCGRDEHRIFLENLADRELPSRERFTIVRCQACGHRYLRPRPRREDIGRYYRADYLPFVDTERGLKGRLLAWRARRWARRIARWIPPGGEVLEVGCASGRLLDALRDHGFHATGLEPSRQAAAIARRKGHRVVVGTAEEAEWKPRSFDTVILIHVIEHVHDPATVLARLHRALKPAGRLFLALPNAESWTAAVFGRHASWEAPRHLQFFTPQTLTRLLSRQAFVVEGRQWGWLPVEWIRGICYALGGPRNWAGRVFAVHNPLWLALLSPFEALAAACGAATRMSFQARKRVRPDASEPSPESPAGSTPTDRRRG